MTRPLTDADKTAIIKQLTGGWSNIFRDTIDIFQRDEFIAGDEVRSPLATAVRELSRLQCRRWARADKSNLSTRQNQITSNICSLYLNSILESPGNGSLSLQFTGGQCECARYSVTYNIGQATSNDIRTATNVRGPIGTLRQEVGALGANGCGATQRRVKVLGFNRGIGGSTCLALEEREYTGFCSSPDRVLRGISVSPNAGQPNNCGDPGDLITQPPTPSGLPALPSTTTIVLPALGPVTATIGINPDGSFEVCIQEIDTCFTIDPTSLADDQPDGGELPPGDIGEPSPQVNTGVGDEAEGEAPEGEVLVGLEITVITQPPSAKIFQGDVFRGLGWVYMGVPGNLALHPSGSTHRENQFTFAEKNNLTAWKVIANTGYNLGIKAYYRGT